MAGTPKTSIFLFFFGFSMINHKAMQKWGTPHFGTPPFGQVLYSGSPVRHRKRSGDAGLRSLSDVSAICRILGGSLETIAQNQGI